MRNAECGIKIPKSEIRIPNFEFQRGFTLIEVIVVIVILSIVSAITINSLINSLQIYTMTVNQKTLFDEGKLALERMCRDIRDGRSITSPASGGSGSAITFTRNNATAQDVAAESITFLDRKHSRKGKGITLVTSSLASNVSTFTVHGVQGNDEITLVLTLSLTSGENVTLQTKVYPKNLPKGATYKNFCQNWMEAYQ
jgi:prepilin-type N-terminal cleavage/methylation domain-containing protein